jgi:hypothetical protein
MLTFLGSFDGKFFLRRLKFAMSPRASSFLMTVFLMEVTVPNMGGLNSFCFMAVSHIKVEPVKVSGD